ncbi:hypothetical protein [Haloplanus halobius]|uniref:hypothetical protein n=1 Tax=Haloplanus halobius TaxID=2934938 RepID=UPI00200ED253|nr:hypothetical protein [Haloplanus sp. XH21]
MLDRRVGTLVLVVLLVAAGSAPAVAGGTETAAEATATWTPAVDAAAMPIAPQQDRPVIHQRAIASRNPEPGSVTITFDYRIPPSVTGLRVGIPSTSADGVSVASTDGFERSSGWFRWDGETERPSVSVRLAVGESLADGVRGVEREDWGLVSEPNTRVQARTDQRPVRTTAFGVASDEPGYAASHLAYLGAHDRRNVTVADERATFVLGGEDVDTSRAADFLRTANEHFDFGVQRDAVTVFVLPLNASETEGIEAATVDDAFWVSEAALQFADTGTVFAHEYVHTRLGPVGAGDAAWLTEAAAEYYGRVFALNDGVGTYDEFLDGLRAPEYAPDRQSVILSQPWTWRGTTAHYDKGAHVLAALDARIQRRTGGERDLRDVFEGRSESFRDYRAFRAAVIGVTGDESIGSWLDRYVVGDALPPLPENPRYYVAAESLDPDGDGAASGAELDRGDHPFVEGADGGVDPMPAAEGATATAGGETTGTTPAATGTSGGAPGFDVVVAVVAVVLATLRLRE